MAAAFAAVGIVLPVPFPQITYDEAMRRFGIDKPDLRLPGSPMYATCLPKPTSRHSASTRAAGCARAGAKCRRALAQGA